MNHFPLQDSMEYPGQQWKQWGDYYPEIYSQSFYEGYSLNTVLGNHADYFHHQNFFNHPTMTLSRRSQNVLLNREGSSSHIIPHQQLENYQQTNQLQRTGFPDATFSSVPRVIVTSRPGLPPYGANNEGVKQNEAPKMCILALAMMIAGIPTVPVPRVKAEDMMVAAQKFRADNPNLSGDIDEMLKDRRERKGVFTVDHVFPSNSADERINWKRTRDSTIRYPQINVLVLESDDRVDAKKHKSNDLMLI
ncbi:uncharacterized protein LOC119969410 [Scyliorhinus canicula]|uniref:uncharacterized protein LOC119969410 n=1 Tax=Scyliorhinus canicula TaxID=7830 RepID=UPI0018F6AC6D|nr:uncharacterized protein LOC119969410 [Scyliorhinus canicula]XP_038658960.1 uncharacterized protein LOC119969410 [Scyliorhinus canicula]XP_038658961.1 uncharacterized protein LOC119969410 [Scyliorhinus canicula]